MKTSLKNLRVASAQQGFTMIELIMVIVIIGILAAFALPRFADLGQQARIATAKGAVSAVKSAANIAHAQYLATGSTVTSVTLEGQAIGLTNGYPNTTDIFTAAGIDTAEWDVTTNVANVKGKTSCGVTYDAAGAGASPTYTLTTSGC